MEGIRGKLLQIVRRHKESKTAFQQLKSQIKICLIEAEEVFVSLAIPLMRLVGLKTEEMAKEGRSTCVLLNTDSKARESCSSQAVKACRELEEKQRLQLQQLLYLLRQIESLVNSRQAGIIQSLENHRLTLFRLFEKSTAYLSAIHQAAQSVDPILAAMFKLLKSVFQQVGQTLSSVEDDVDNMVRELAEKMCQPMVGHVKVLKAEMVGGPATRLVGAVKEMEKMVKERGLEAEAARQRAKTAEEARAEALRTLREFELKVRSMKESVGMLMQTKQRRLDHPNFTVLAREKDKSLDDKLLWKILKQKRQREEEQEAAHKGPTNLHVDTRCNGYLRRYEISTIEPPSRAPGPPPKQPILVSPRPITRSYSRRLANGEPSMPGLGPSPSSVGSFSSTGSHKRCLSSIGPRKVRL